MEPASSMKELATIRPKTSITVAELPLPNMIYSNRLWQETDIRRIFAVAEKNVWNAYIEMVSNRRSQPQVFAKTVHQYNDYVNGLFSLYEEFLPEEEYAELRGE